jgi:hypothetical protein
MKFYLSCSIWMMNFEVEFTQHYNLEISYMTFKFPYIIVITLNP